MSTESERVFLTFSLLFGDKRSVWQKIVFLVSWVSGNRHWYIMKKSNLTLVGRNRSFSDATLIEVACVAKRKQGRGREAKDVPSVYPRSRIPLPRFYACYAVYAGYNRAHAFWQVRIELKSRVVTERCNEAFFAGYKSWQHWLVMLTDVVRRSVICSTLIEIWQGEQKTVLHGLYINSPSIWISSSDLTRLLASCSLSEPRLLQIESISSIKIVLGA